MELSKPLGLDRVTSDVLVKPGLGPLCLSSFEAFKRGWRVWREAKYLTQFSSDVDGRGGYSEISTVAPESSAESIAQPTPPHLVITNYASLQFWNRCCVCDRRKQCEGDCPNVIVYTSNETAENSKRAERLLDPTPAGIATSFFMGTTFFCITYATLNARAEKIKRQQWGAVILEFSNTIPFPHSYTVCNLLELKCVQWYTINKPLVSGQRKFETRWQDLYWEAQFLRSNAAVLDVRHKSFDLIKQGGRKASESPPRPPLAEERNKRPSVMLTTPTPSNPNSGCEKALSREGSPNKSSPVGSSVKTSSPSRNPLPVGGSFWSYMEPGIGMDPASENMPGCHSVLAFLADWIPSSANAHVRLSCPVLCQGIWHVRAEPCELDQQMLAIAAANIPPDRYEDLYNEYFLTTHCPLDFARLHCLVCGSACADVLLICCRSVYHRDCLLSELYCDVKCPKCGVEPEEAQSNSTLIELEAWLLAPGSYCVVDLHSSSFRNHDWSCQLTRQVITSAIQAHLSSTIETIDRELRCFTARVHNAEALTNKIFHETRDLPINKPSPRFEITGKNRFRSERQPLTIHPIDISSPLSEPEELYIFFTAKSTECNIKPRNDHERYLVITLVAGIFDNVTPLLGKNAATLQNIRFKLQV